MSEAKKLGESKTNDCLSTMPQRQLARLHEVATINGYMNLSVMALVSSLFTM